jgi:hypothetical protein
MTVVRLPPRFADGLRHFNAGRFFEAHEVFEDLLDDVDDARWELLVGLVQVAVGYHKWSAGHPGASRMLRLGAGKLAALPTVAYGVAVASLRDRAEADAATLDGGGTLGEAPRIEMRRGVG